MRRGLVITGTFLSVLVLGFGLAAYGWWKPALAAGRKTYYYRPLLTGPGVPAPYHPLRVAWFGDSTLMDVNAYPLILGKTITGSDASLLALPGLDAFGFYCAMDREIRRTQPRVVGMIAHVGNLHRGFGAPVGDVASELPVPALPTAIGLPLHEFGITVPKLLLYRMLRWDRATDLVLFLDGINRVAQERLLESWAGPKALPLLQNLPQALEVVNGVYAAPFSARTAKVRIMAESVRVARQRGVRALVVVQPFPVYQLRAAGLYDPDVFAARVDGLRGEIEGAGGMLVDLHDAIDADGFRDAAGHMNEKGHRRAAELLREPLERLLSIPPHAAAS